MHNSDTNGAHPFREPGQSAAVVEVKVCDQQEVDVPSFHVVCIRHLIQTNLARVDAAIQLRGTAAREEEGCRR